MNTDKQQVQPQDAPDKNTDAAFVKVGADGKPVLPQDEPSTEDNNEQRPKEGTLADR